RRNYRHAYLGKTDAHARKGKGTPTTAQKPLGDNDIDDHRAHQSIAQGHKGQSHYDELSEAFDVTKQQISDADGYGTNRQQPTPAITVNKLSYQRRDGSPNETFTGTEQGKYAAENCKIGSQRLEKDAKSAGQRKRRRDIGEEAGTDNVPAVEESPVARASCHLLHQCHYYSLTGISGCTQRNGFLMRATG